MLNLRLDGQNIVIYHLSVKIIKMYHHKKKVQELLEVFECFKVIVRHFRRYAYLLSW